MVEGGTSKGNLGRVEHTYAVEKPFSLTLRIPAVLSAWDTLEMPIVLKNTSDQVVEGFLTVDSSKYLDLLTDLSSRIKLLENSVKVIYVKSLVKNKSGVAPLRIAFKGSGLVDVVQQKMEVISKGFPSNFSLSGKAKMLQDSFIIPLHYNGSLETEFRVYSTILDDLMGGTEVMLRYPSGCFEQVSSVNYPNILVLQVLKEKGNLAPEIKKKATRYLETGYQKLVGYEIKGGGFEWYGKSPAHEGLTAYGLVQLNDMQSVYTGLDKAVLERTKAFLLSRRDGQGGFYQNVGMYGFSGNKKALFNTYITWALSEVGTKNLSLEVERSVQEAIKSEDLYRLSLACLSLFNLEQKEQAEDLLIQIIKQIKKQGLSNVQAASTVTSSSGNSLNIETLSFAGLAMMRSSKPNVALLEAIQKHILGKRSYGRFGTTQSTVMALKMLLEYQKKYVDVPEEGQFKVYINDRLAQEYFYKKGPQPKVLFSDFDGYLTQRKNKVRIEIEGTPLSCALNTKWNSIQPQSTAEPKPIAIKTSLKDSLTQIGEIVSMKIQLSNLEDKQQASPMAIVGIPAGLSLQAWQLKELQEQDAFAYYEIKNNQLILYFRSMEAKEQKVLQLYLKAEVSGKYEAPVNSAYLYYKDELKYWESGVNIQILK